MNKTLELVRPLPPMRGVKQAVEEIKKDDPNTALTERALRRMILTGEIPHVKAGTKYLVNMNVLNDYLYKGTQAAEHSAEPGQLRVVKE